MQINHHWQVADLLAEQICREMKIRLDISLFKLGSCYPDMPFSMPDVPHTKPGAFNMVMEMAGSLTSDFSLLRYRYHLRRFSWNLGVIMHFISDFFCYVHNDPHFISCIWHYVYENKLFRDFLLMKEQNIHDIFRNTKGIRRTITIDYLPVYLSIMHKEYLKGHYNTHKDINYSLNMCLVTAFSILNSCKNSKNEYAA